MCLCQEVKMEEFQRPMDQVKDYIQRFTLDSAPNGNQGYNRILLQLFGYMGHGKSSLVNSCKYCLENEPYKQYAKAKFSYGGVTVSRKAYKLTPSITIVDNRGCATIGSFETGEIYAQLGNFIPLNQKVIWPTNFADMVNRLEESEMDPNFTDFIYPVFVYSVKKSLAEEEKSEIKTFIKNCRDMTGVVPTIVLTHKTAGDYFEMERSFKLMGAEQVIKLENYTAEDHMKTRGRDTEILKFLYNSIEDVSFRMGSLRNPRRERVERKKFLLRYFYDVTRMREEDMSRGSWGGIES